MRLESLHIFGIFDRQDILFEFERRPFFLVGPNGTGKSTALKIVHSILTAQWDRLEPLPFIGVEIVLSNDAYAFDKSDFERIGRIKALLLRRGRKSRRSHNILPTTWEGVLDDLKRGSSHSRLPPINQSILKELETNYESISVLNNFAEAETKGHVLYFPTYRRVERDLKDLLENDEDDWDDSPSLAPAIADRFHSSGEVVGFGGQDIRLLLTATAARIEGEARQALNEHSVRFLQSISTDQKVDTKRVKDLIQSKERVSHLIERISTFAPSTVDLSAVSGSIDSLAKKLTSGGRGRLNQREDTLLTYLSELIKLFDRIEELSFPLRRFSQLISSYLGPAKRADLRESDNAVIIYDASGTEILLDQLSSGEKQILSFFAFLLLKSDLKKSFIIIDEPELSLSVSWQKSLIRDILSISAGAYLVSATHSPFIFSSFGLDYVESLGEL